MPHCLTNRTLRMYAEHTEPSDVRAMAQELLRARKKLAEYTRPKIWAPVEVEVNEQYREVEYLA